MAKTTDAIPKNPWRDEKGNIIIDEGDNISFVHDNKNYEGVVLEVKSNIAKIVLENMEVKYLEV